MTYSDWESGEPLPNEPSARIIADSITPDGHRLTTFEIKFHRFVLAEVNTHTLFSRNSASSRAIPLRSKNREARTGTLDRLENSGPAFPIKWPKEQPGMQGADEEVDERILARYVWEDAMDSAINYAEHLAEIGVHKSICNRLLEPFNWHIATISAVDWEGFFRQRSWNRTKLVQPEFGAVATIVEDLYNASRPEEIEEGDWHLPYIRKHEKLEFTEQELCKLSSARTARTSYLTHEGVRDVEADFVLFDRLHTADPPHASPLQHIATPAAWNETTVRINPENYGWEGNMRSITVPLVGNARGWLQLRHIVIGW